jgi:hypothetical protein
MTIWHYVHKYIIAYSMIIFIKVRKVTQEETRERKKQYEKEWERKFINSWKQDRPLASSQRWTKCYAGASKPMDQKSYIYKAMTTVFWSDKMFRINDDC